MITNAGRLSRAALLGCALFAGGCAEQAYIYRPAEQATSVVQGRTAARYAIPPEAPEGDVRVVSFGVVDVRRAERDEEVPALHVRLVVSNDGGDTPWQVDTRRIRAELRRAGDAGEPLVSTDRDGLPVVEVPPGQQRVIDVFYPLPEGVEGEGDIPAFDVLWRVRTSKRLVAERTPFERIALEHRSSYVLMTVPWWGPYWWYDPWYYPFGVRPSAFVGPRMLPPHIIVRPHPR